MILIFVIIKPQKKINKITDNFTCGYDYFKTRIEPKEINCLTDYYKIKTIDDEIKISYEYIAATEKIEGNYLSSIDGGDYILDINGKGKFCIGEYKEKELSLKNESLALDINGNSVNIAKFKPIEANYKKVLLYYDKEEIPSNGIRYNCKLIKLKNNK